MARNKHPQETVNLILDVSFRLFIEKGYEHTSIQDIIDHLGGLSKGAIYHHFKSKEDILVAVTDRMTEESNKMLAAIRDNAKLTGLEKLRKLCRESVLRPEHDGIFAAAPNLKDNPRLVFAIIRDSVDVVAPQYILPILQQGLQDGSIQTEYPEELAELLMLSANVWMNPMMFDDTPEKCYRKFMVLRLMMKGMGLDIFDEEVLERLKELSQIYQNNK